jgi:GT2 family glycosyltransferase
MSDNLNFPAIRVAIVLVNWNGWRECIECIDSVLGQAHPNFRLFVVDNDSADRSIEHIAAWCAAPEADADWRRQANVGRYTDAAARTPVAIRVLDKADHALALPKDESRLWLIRSGGNLGFAGGCNVAIKAAGLEEFAYFWFLNPDTVVTRQALAELLGRAQRGPRIGIVGSTLRYYHAPGTVQALGGAALDRGNASSWHIGEGQPTSIVPSDGSAVERELAYVMGASMLVSASFIRTVGLMQEDYFLYYEEADWAQRGRAQFDLGYAPRSEVFHKSGANSSELMPMYTAAFYYRNRLRFVRRFLPDRIGAAKRRLCAEMLYHLARGRWGLARIIAKVLVSKDEAAA